MLLSLAFIFIIWQALEREGLQNYVTAEVIEKEIAEANDLSPRAVDAASRKLSQEGPLVQPGSVYSSAEDIFCDTDSEHMSAL